MYPTHYVGDKGYVSDTEDTLSFEGEDVKHYREKKHFILQSTVEGIQLQQDQSRNEL